MLTKIIYAMLVMVPVTLVLEFGGIGGHSLVFISSALAMIPLAAILGRATEEVAIYTGSKIGALLNATLGNAAELIITIIALREGLVNVVKASIAGSVIGNILVVLGAALLLGGLKNGTQRFDARTAGTNATMMTLAILALTVPAVFAIGSPEHHPTHEDVEFLSDGVAIILIITYVLYLIYSLSERSPAEVEQETHGPASMSLRLAAALLAGSTLAIVVMSEVLVGAIEPTAEDWGLTELFIGVMLVPLVGNIAEHLVAVQVAYDNKVDLALGIAIGSGLQIAIFVAPVLVLVSQFVGPDPMTLVFNNFELLALGGGALIAVLVSVDGESNWLEGAELIALYLILGTAFFFVP